ncbi:MAG: hypothetical protein IJ300_02780 [Clostridia bacterium]|nr:hypothetical protein [Clostridia bacterium]
MSLKNDIVKEDAEQYRKTNGTVLRTILARWRVAKFSWRDLILMLAAYNIEKEDVMEAMLSFNESGYVTARLRENHQIVSMWDYVDELDELEFNLAKAGRDAAYNIASDPSIDM